MSVALYAIFIAWKNAHAHQNQVTYRSLSRALKVHANRAKHLLFEFHRNENAKKPQTVHATYVISGIQKAPEPSYTNGHGNDEDETMQSSPYLPSSMLNQDLAPDSSRPASIVLAREEDLEDAKSTFLSISTIHVYSLEPTTLPDLNVLVDASREIANTHAQEDPLECGKQWGMIQNRNVKRRTGARPPPAAAPSAKAPIGKAPKPSTESTVPAKRPLQREVSAPKAETAKSDEPKSETSSAANSQASSKPSGKTAPAKQKGSLFSSFAKAKPKSKASTPAESAPASAGEDVVLDDASEEEAEELFPNSTDNAAAATRENRKEREERLKKMMEDDEDEADDEEMPDADDEPREPTPIEQPPPFKPAELKEEVSVQGGRRRGKRQVMKKKTVKDEEGYLVTREEATWESFSEDEPMPKKKPVNVPKAKAGKAAGQGNIMSFFGKK
ncbi:hypothetical protein N7475_009317 [Penicillium sp. IBT 31633x]|nr:hypothetical protein N7475_009317 [Penicillium sp. IBT 31633x]